MNIAAAVGSVHTPWGGKSADQALAVALQEGVIGLGALPLAYGPEGRQVTLHVAGQPRTFVLDTGAQVNLLDEARFACPCWQAPMVKRYWRRTLNALRWATRRSTASLAPPSSAVRREGHAVAYCPPY